MMQQMILEGSTFVGCLQAAPKAAAAQAASALANATRVGDLLAMLEPTDLVVLTAKTVASRGGAMFIRPTQLTVAAMAAASAADVLTSIPGRAAPTSQAWAQSISQSSASGIAVDTASNDATGTAEANAAEDSAGAGFGPMSGPPAASGGGNRRMLQVVDNRWWVTDTTVWPWPALSKITLGCSGTLMSPGEHALRELAKALLLGADELGA